MIRALRLPVGRKIALLALSGLSGLVLGASGAASAPPAPPPGPGMMGPPPPFAAEMARELDLDGDGRVTRAELEKAGQQRARGIDVDGDGVISVEEIIAFQDRERRRHEETMLASLDSNGDGRVTIEEFVSGGSWRLARLDRNGDGVIDGGELRPPHDRPGPKPACD